MTPQEKKETFKKGTLCYRCGALKKDKRPCSVWGKSYEKHMWNTDDIEIEAIEIKITTLKNHDNK